MFVKTRLHLVLAALLAAGGVAPAVNAEGIGLQPARVEMEVDPGANARQIVTLANVNRDRPVSLSLRLADWTQDEDGRIALSPPGEGEESAAGWVRLNTSSVTLAPGKSKQVMVTLSPPDGLTRLGDYRFALLASTVLPEADGSWKRHEVTSLFYLTAGAAESRPQILASRLTVTGDGVPAIGLDFANTGNAHARLEGTIEIRGEGVDPRTLPVRDLVVLNGATRRFLVPLDAPLPANPVIEVRLDNVFAPQMDNETQALAPYRVQTETQVSSLSGPVGGQD